MHTPSSAPGTPPSSSGRFCSCSAPSLHKPMFESETRPIEPPAVASRVLAPSAAASTQSKGESTLAQHCSASCAVRVSCTQSLIN